MSELKIETLHQNLEFSAKLAIATFENEDGNLAKYALDLFALAALPVVFTAELLHLLRINFLEDVPEDVKYNVELKILFSTLCAKVDEELGLYEIDPSIRILLLERLIRRFGRKQIEDVAYFLYEYADKNSSWKQRTSLYFAQQLSALNYINPRKAAQWLSLAQIIAGGGEDVDKTWFVAIRKKLLDISTISKKHRTVDNTRGSHLWLFNYFRQSILTNLLDDLYDLESKGVDDYICDKIQSFLVYFSEAVKDVPDGGFPTGSLYRDMEEFIALYKDWNEIKGEGEQSRQKRRRARFKLKEQRQIITNKSRRIQYELDRNLDRKLLKAGYNAIGDLTALAPDMLNHLTTSFNEFVKPGGKT